MNVYEMSLDPYQSAGHLGVVREMRDWGGPGEWTAVCSCGWVGTTFTDYPSNDPQSNNGTSVSALRELLEHANYDPVEGQSRTNHRTHDGIAEIQALTASGINSSGAAASEMLGEVADIAFSLRKEIINRQFLTAVFNGEIA